MLQWSTVFSYHSFKRHATFAYGLGYYLFKIYVNISEIHFLKQCFESTNQRKFQSSYKYQVSHNVDKMNSNFVDFNHEIYFVLHLK